MKKIRSVQQEWTGYNLHRALGSTALPPSFIEILKSPGLGCCSHPIPTLTASCAQQDLEEFDYMTLNTVSNHAFVFMMIDLWPPPPPWSGNFLSEFAYHHYDLNAQHGRLEFNIHVINESMTKYF